MAEQRDTSRIAEEIPVGGIILKDASGKTIQPPKKLLKADRDKIERMLKGASK